jgi:hypothetical protein
MGRAAWFGIFLVLMSSWAGARPLCRLERPVLRGAEVEVLATKVSLEGRLLQRVGWAAAWPQGEVGPVRRRRWQPERQPLRFVIVVEASAAYAEATDALRDGLRRFLRALPKGSEGALWRFAEGIEGLSGMRPALGLLGEASRYNATVEGELRLVRTLWRAQQELLAGPAEARRALVVVADGRNSVMDRRLFYRVGEELGQNEVPVHAIGYSARDVRGPLKNLGDLAKRSGGTFRWARAKEELGPQLMNLAEELNGADVLTFPAVGQGAGQLLRLRCDEGMSNPARLRSGPPRGMGPWGWVGAGAVVLGGAGLAWRWWRRARRREALRRVIRAPVVERPVERAPVAAGPEVVVAAATLVIGGGALAPAPAEGAVLVAGDGRRLPVGERLELGSQGRRMAIVRRERGVYKLDALVPGVRLNGHALLGAMRLNPGDTIGLEEGGRCSGLEEGGRCSEFRFMHEGVMPGGT